MTMRCGDGLDTAATSSNSGLATRWDKCEPIGEPLLLPSLLHVSTKRRAAAINSTSAL